MKKFDKSKIMRLAHQLKNREGYTMSQALTIAWSNARRDDFYLIIEVRKRKRYSGEKGSIMHDMDAMAESLSNYYKYNTYNGD